MTHIKIIGSIIMYLNISWFTVLNLDTHSLKYLDLKKKKRLIGKNNVRQ